MKFRIILILGLSIFFFLTPKLCLAKTIEIDRVIYNVEDVLEKDSFIYDAKTNTLTLKNATLKTIKTSNDLKINLIGENLLSNDNMSLDSLVAKNLEISGEKGSSLKIVTKKRGIVGERVQISFANISIIADKDAIVSSSNSNYDMIINQSTLNIETKNDGFNVVSGNLYFNDSNVQVNGVRNLIGGFGKLVHIINTNLEILEAESIRVNQQKIYVTGNSYVFVKALNNYFNTINYVLSEGLSILGSQDGINYQEIGLKDKYIKIISKKESLKEKEEYLRQLENDLSQLEKELLLKESNLIELEKELSKKEEKLKKQEEDMSIQKEKLNEREKKLKEDQETLENLHSSIKKREQEVSTLKKNVLEEKENLDKFRITLKEREQEVSTLKKNVLEEKENLDKFTVTLKEKENLLNQKEEELKLKLNSLKDLEYDCKEIRVEDYVKEEENVVKNTLDNDSKNENSIENPKTYNNFTVSIWLCIVSFFALISTIVIIRKKECFHG